VIHKGNLTEAFNTYSGMQQGRILSPTLFLIVMDNVKRTVTQTKRSGIRWSLHGRLELDYADDVCLLSQSYKDTSKKICSLQAEAATPGLKIHSKNTTELQTNSKINTNVNDEIIERVEQFTYFGSVVIIVSAALQHVNMQITVPTVKE
jgi:hypothetical protein